MALLIGGTLVFVIGNTSNIFQSKATYYAVFEDVEGLRAGSPVRIGGVSVGTVSGVELGDQGEVRVEIEIVDAATDHVRHGSHAVVSSKGMLGDKLLDVSVGDGERYEAGATIPTTESEGLGDYMQTAGRILADVQQTITNLRSASEPLGEPEFAQAIRDTSRNVSQITLMAAEGDGTVNRLLSDPSLADDVQTAVRELRTASTEVATTSRAARNIVQEVESGDGTAHELIYGQQGTRMVRNFADAAGEVATLLERVREGEGTAHDLIYEDAGGQLMANLQQASEDIKAITGDIRQGKGTLGALIQDPSVYEDVKRLLGDLERNEILRSLVRYSIKRDDSLERPRVEPAD